MMHRFRHEHRGTEGHDPALLGRVLSHLRREGYVFMPLHELLVRLSGGASVPRRTVAFTLDDGYADHAEVAAPVFREFDCPVTTFVASGFLDGELWYWWDQVEYVLQRTERRSLLLPLADAPEVQLDGEDQRAEAKVKFTTWCKGVRNAEKRTAVASLAERAGVDLPDRAPPEYAPMSWDQLRRCEEGGMTFGPHTVSHPVLSMEPDAQAREEIGRSWTRLEEEAADPVPVFCYPNGRSGNFGSREADLLRENDFAWAVTALPGYVSGYRLVRDSEARFRVPRFSYPDSLGGVMRIASGLERLREIVGSGGA